MKKWFIYVIGCSAVGAAIFGIVMWVQKWTRKQYRKGFLDGHADGIGTKYARPKK